MASPTPKSGKHTQEPLKRSTSRPGASGGQPEAVDPVWLLKAGGLTLVAALVCGYLTICLLFYQGQWQLVLHPSRTAATPATIAGAHFETIRFGVDESGTPQLNGWWIPADSGAKYSGYTVLYLPSGDGLLADAQPTLAALHSMGLNVFAFDYRGYGQSGASHPNQARMTQDAASAWGYLRVSRALAGAKVIPFGSGVGCALAAKLAEQHEEVPAVIFDSPRPDLMEIVLADSRTQYLPVRMLFHDRFDIAGAAQSLKTPKLFLLPDQKLGSGKDGGPQQPSQAELQALVDAAGVPKMSVYLKPSDRDGTAYPEEVSRFLDQYLH